mmetsp:Transcript_2469/g.2754  ORF Transcript_2469/g.2754 Transcript_2469/m.2754 type:complete len:340 (+) Transcript_2469:107-1126(+)
MINSIIRDQIRVENTKQPRKIFIDASKELEPPNPLDNPGQSLLERAGVREPTYKPPTEKAQIAALQRENEALKQQIEQNTLSVTKSNFQGVFEFASFTKNLLIATSDTYLLATLPLAAVGFGIAVQRRHAGWWRPIPALRLTCLPLITMVFGAATRVYRDEQQDLVYDPPLRRMLYATGLIASTFAFSHYALRMRMLAGILGPLTTFYVGYEYELIPETGVFESILDTIEETLDNPVKPGIDYMMFERQYMDNKFASKTWDRKWLAEKDIHTAMRVHVERAYARRNDNIFQKSYRTIVGEGKDYVKGAVEHFNTQEERIGEATLAELGEIERKIEKKLQ